MSNVECREWSEKRLEPCQRSLRRLPDIALWGEKKEKGKMKGNQIWEKITAHTEISSVPTGYAGKRALCVTANKTPHSKGKYHLKVEILVLCSYFALKVAIVPGERWSCQPKTSNLHASFSKDQSFTKKEQTIFANMFGAEMLDKLKNPISLKEIRPKSA